MRLTNKHLPVIAAGVTGMFLAALFAVEPNLAREDSYSVKYGTTPSVFKTTPPAPVDTEICIYRMPEIESWPVDDAAWDWNKNNKNRFVEGRLSKRCAGTVVISEVSGVEWWGRTHFLGNGVVSMYLSTSVPVEFRRSVTCHELGHVLGAPHTGERSCMVKGGTHPEPSPNEIASAGKSLWNDGLAASQAQGE